MSLVPNTRSHSEAVKRGWAAVRRYSVSRALFIMSGNIKACASYKGMSRYWKYQDRNLLQQHVDCGCKKYIGRRWSELGYQHTGTKVETAKRVNADYETAS